MKTSTYQSYQDRLFRVLTFIQDHLDEPLPLSVLARVACFSPHHFHRIFRGMVGESVKEHVRRLRLERAAQTLRREQKTILEIALDAGYESHEAFSRAFKTFCGFNPQKFRRQKNEEVPLHWGIRYGERPQQKHLEIFHMGGKTVRVTIKEIQPIYVAYLRHHGPYDTCGETWDRILPQLGKLGLLGSEDAILGVCHDDPEVTPDAEIRYDVCVVVDESFQPEQPLKTQWIAGGTYAVITHTGPYNQLGKAYADLCGKWLPTSGWETNDQPAFEIYLNDPESTEPEDLITEIHFPVKTNGGTQHDP